MGNNIADKLAFSFLAPQTRKQNFFAVICICNIKRKVGLENIRQEFFSSSFINKLSISMSYGNNILLALCYRHQRLLGGERELFGKLKTPRGVR